MAFNLPVEGEDGPFAGAGLAETARCGPDEGAGEVVRRLIDEGEERAVVVNDHDVVLGLVTKADLEGSPPNGSVNAVMGLSPATVRPSVVLSSVAEDGKPVLVTNSDGVLLGVVEPRPASQVGEDSEMDQLQGTFLEIAHAVEEHFDGEDPSEDEVRAFLRERLVGEGKTPEEAEAYLAAMDRSSGDGGV